MNLKAAIPNSLTLANLVCGTVGILLAMSGNMFYAAICIGLAAVFDFFDGMAARALGVSGELGKQLDSLADMVTFGVLPGIMLFNFISIGFNDYFVPLTERSSGHLLAEFSGLLYTLAAAIRLGKFNIDNRQADSFIGVPTPAAAIFVAAFPVILSYQYDLNMYHPLNDHELAALMHLQYWRPFDFHLVYNLFDPLWWVLASVLLAGFMLSPFRMLNFKFKNNNWNDNKHRYLFLIITGLLVLITFLPYWVYIPNFPFLDFTVVPIIILLYILYSMIIHFTKKHEL